jgi:uncharacterized protein (DUF362 family)
MTGGLQDHRVAVAYDHSARQYPAPPFAPPVVYPELARLRGGRETDASNRVYPLVRQALRDLGLDAAHADSDQWNPLGDVIRPGDTVLLKPNLVRHFHGFGWDPLPLVTHAAVVRAIVDYVDLALGNDGAIVIADAPLQTADFAAVTELAGLQALAAWYERNRGRPLPLLDLRLTAALTTASGYITGHAGRAGDDAGYVAVDLGSQSCLAQISGAYAGFRATNYAPAAMRQHHNPKRHEYLIARQVLDADVILNIPKLKTHRKVGVTAALKNMIGINGHKDWLPHHRRGARDNGGDEYWHRSRWKAISGHLLDLEEAQTNPKMKQLLRIVRRAAGGVSLLTRRDSFMEGSWWGNDTLWRTVLDLNRILYYADRSGTLQLTPQRRVLTVIDGIIAGEGEGPLEPTAKPCGVIIAGHNPVAVDAVAARMMGFDYQRIPIIARAGEIKSYPLIDFPYSALAARSARREWDRLDPLSPGMSLEFQPAAGWRGVIELAAHAIHDNRP